MAFLIAGTTLLLTFGAAPAFADNGPHVTTAFGSLDGSGNVVQSPGQDNVRTDRCAGCHRAHTATGAMLLMVSDESQLCYSCHGSAGVGATTDVVDGVQYSTADRTGSIAGALRGGGFSKAELGNASVTIVNGSRGLSADKSKTVIGLTGAPVATTSAHDVNSASALVAWGGGAPGTGTGVTLNAATQLECTSCHDPHGNGNYRILRPVPVGAPTGTAAVTIADSATKLYTTTNYWLVDDPYSATVAGPTGALNTSAFLGNISSWCATCHTRTLAASGGYATALVSINAGATSYSATFVGGNATFTFTGTAPTPVVGDNIAFTTITPSNAPAANLVPGFVTNVLYRVFSINGTTMTVGNPTSTSALKPTTGYNGTATFVLGTQTTKDGVFTFRHRSDNSTISLQTGVTTRGTPITNGVADMNILGFNNPNCLTCHVAHGSNADMSGDANSQFSKTVKDPAGNVPAGGDSYLLRVSNRGMCKLCHNV
jgi:predicted CXXCH cytochrome family protein